MQGVVLATCRSIHSTQGVFSNSPISTARASVMSNNLTAKAWKHIPFEHNGKSMLSKLHRLWFFMTKQHMSR